MSDHRRFFVDPHLLTTKQISIEGAVARQVNRVLRLKTDDHIILLDGLGNSYDARIILSTPQLLNAQIVDKRIGDGEPVLELVLASCVPKSDRIELIVQKCTELGISEMMLIRSERTVVRLDESGGLKKTERLGKIAAEAAEQCGRSMIPRLRGVIDFDDLTRRVADFDLAIIAWEEEDKSSSLRDVLRTNVGAKSVLLIVGPEGGLTSSEVELAKSAGAVSVSFGSRVLRTDTAAIAGCAAIMYELEGQL